MLLAVWLLPTQARRRRGVPALRRIARSVAHGFPELHRATGTPVPCSRPQNSLGELPERLTIPLERPFLRCIKLLPPRRGFGRRYDELLTVGTDIEWRVGIDFEQIKNRAINYERQTVSVFGQLLHHSNPVSPMYHHGQGTARLACLNL